MSRQVTEEEVFLRLENATVGRFDRGSGIIGQLGVRGKGPAVLDHCKLGNLLLTEDEGTIEARDVITEGELRVQQSGRPISLPQDISAQGEQRL